MITPNTGEVWYCDLPKEEKPEEIMRDRPCIIVDQNDEEFVVIKVTKHSPRKNDKYDTVIEKWRECGLSRPSTARISKIANLNRSQLKNCKGKLEVIDEINISKKLEEFLDDNF